MELRNVLAGMTGAFLAFLIIRIAKIIEFKIDTLIKCHKYRILYEEYREIIKEANECGNTQRAVDKRFQRLVKKYTELLRI